MRVRVARLVLLLVLIGMLLITLAASPVAAHCVQTPVGWVNLDPGHFAAAGGHQSAIDHSGGTVGLCDVSGTELNEPAPPNNPERR
jgi:hypothetical protein